MTVLDFEHLAGELPALQECWRAAGSRGTPFVIVEGLLLGRSRQQVCSEFPSLSWPVWEHVGDRLQALKASSEKIDRFPASVASLVHDLNSGPMIRALEALTGIAGLVPDPHLWGGGLHVTMPGGYLWPHTDFLHGQQACLRRVVNLLIYVHPRWEASMGGHFQFWRDGAVVESIVPLPGRCVIFRTDAQSIHGVSEVTGDVERRSVALFYYVVDQKAAVSNSTTGWHLELDAVEAAVGVGRRRLAAALIAASGVLSSASMALNRNAEQVMNSGRSRLMSMPSRADRANLPPPETG